MSRRVGRSGSGLRLGLLERRKEWLPEKVTFSPWLRLHVCGLSPCYRVDQLWNAGVVEKLQLGNGSDSARRSIKR